MPRIDFREIPAPTEDSSDTDAFEKFCREFFVHVLQWTVCTQPARGVDAGLDLQLEDVAGNRCLVSCKHFVRSKRSVGRNDEQDILDRLHEHGCSKFIGFYSTVASTGLRDKLIRLRERRGVQFEIYDSEMIERLLLEGTRGFDVAKRFFPESVQNVAPTIITLLPTYAPLDAVPHSGRWKIVDPAGQLIATGDNREYLAQIANERAMFDFHAPPYLRAWKDAVTLYPNFFVVPAEGIEKARAVSSLRPAWDRAIGINDLSPMERSFIGAVWGLYDSGKAAEAIRIAEVDTVGKTVSAPTFDHLACSATVRRDVLARLLAFYSPVA